MLGLSIRASRIYGIASGSSIGPLPIRYYLSSDTEISHASDDGVFLPIDRVKMNTAPYLHETTHILAPCAHCPTWFSEGFASFVQSYISKHRGGYDGAVFAKSGNAGIDREAACWLATANGSAVAPFLGSQHDPPGMSYDRSNIAAPFYVMSQSLVKFIVLHAGWGTIRHLLTATDFDRDLKRFTGKSVAEWKREWLASLRWQRRELNRDP